jgi:predicted N-formylglutamate amidohydrolase
MELYLLPTDELIDELLERFGAAMFIGVRHNYEAKDEDNYTIRWKGAISTLRGLVEIERDLLRDESYELWEE